MALNSWEMSDEEERLCKDLMSSSSHGQPAKPLGEEAEDVGSSSQETIRNGPCGPTVENVVGNQDMPPKKRAKEGATEEATSGMGSGVLGNKDQETGKKRENINKRKQNALDEGSEDEAASTDEPPQKQRSTSQECSGVLVTSEDDKEVDTQMAETVVDGEKIK